MPRLKPEQHRERALELRIEAEQLDALTHEPGWKTIRLELASCFMFSRQPKPKSHAVPSSANRATTAS